MSSPEGFRYEVRKQGDIIIFHHGRLATTLRGDKAASFLADVAEGDAQELMARATGNYQHGNERRAAEHPRNRS